MKTAVEFYDQQLNIIDLRLKSGSITDEEYFSLRLKLYEQAKQMEKEQIIEANENKMPFISGNEYYNETYKNTDDEMD